MDQEKQSLYDNEMESYNTETLLDCDLKELFKLGNMLDPNFFDHNEYGLVKEGDSFILNVSYYDTVDAVLEEIESHIKIVWLDRTLRMY